MYAYVLYGKSKRELMDWLHYRVQDNKIKIVLQKTIQNCHKRKFLLIVIGLTTKDKLSLYRIYVTSGSTKSILMNRNGMHMNFHTDITIIER